MLSDLVLSRTARCTRLPCRRPWRSPTWSGRNTAWPTWLQVIKLYGCLHGFDEVLAANRKRSDSLSANKVSAVKGTWFLYTEIEGLSKPYAGYCLFWQMFHAVLKRIGKR